MRHLLLMILFFSVLAGCDFISKRQDGHTSPFDPVGGIYVTDGIVQGTITNYDGEAMSGFHVSIYTLSGDSTPENEGITYRLVSRATYTNDAGFFQFTEMLVDAVCQVSITSPADYVETFGGNYRVIPQSYAAVNTSVQVGRISAQTPGSVVRPEDEWNVHTQEMHSHFWFAQSFKPTGSPLRVAKIWVEEYESAGIISVCADDNGTPGAVLGTVEGCSGIEADPKPFSSEIPVTIGSTYWLLYGTASKFRYFLGNPYSDGTMKSSTDSGATWTNEIPPDVELSPDISNLSELDARFAVYY